MNIIQTTVNYLKFHSVKTFVYIILELINKPPLPSLNIYIKITCFK